MNNVASILSLDVVEGPRPSHKYENAFEIPIHCEDALLVGGDSIAC